MTGLISFCTTATDWQWTPPRDINNAATTWYTATGGNETRRPVACHFDGFNVAYLDGHVKFARATSFFGPLLAGETDSNIATWDKN